MTHKVSNIAFAVASLFIVLTFATCFGSIWLDGPMADKMGETGGLMFFVTALAFLVAGIRRDYEDKNG